jgi:hypothetical protein
MERKMKTELTGKQAYELKWFCRNVVGTRQEYYEVMEKALAFDKRLERLEKTCELIEQYFGEKLTSLYGEPFGAQNEKP